MRPVVARGDHDPPRPHHPARPRGAVKIEGWHIIDTLGVEPLATRPDYAWATINDAGGYPSLEVRHCDESARASVPVAVVDALLDAWRRQRDKP